MDHPSGTRRPQRPPLTWQRWLLGAVAGTVGYLVAHGAVQMVLGPAGRIGNTGIYAAMAIGLLAGTVIAGVTVKARTARRWFAAFLLTVAAVAGIGLIAISPWVFFRPRE